MLGILLLLGGGITLAEFGLMALVTLNALFFSLTLGIRVFLMCRSAQKSSAACSLTSIFFMVLSPAVGALMATLQSSSSVNHLYLAPSVGFSYYLAFDGPYRLNKEWFWFSLGVVQAVSWLGLVVASLITPRSWQDKRVGSSGRGWRERWREWSYGNPRLRHIFRRDALELNPFFWLNARDRMKAVGPWMFLLLLSAVWMWCWWKFRHEWLNEGVYVTTAWLVNLALRYWFAGEATRCMAEQRKAGALELLLSTPLRVEEILRGQWLALRRQFFGPVIAVLIVEVVFMLASVKEAAPEEERMFWFALWSGGMLILIADLCALYVIGSWQGLTARNPLRALGATLLRVLAFPWAMFLAVLLLMALLQMGTHGFHSSPSWVFFVGLWFGLGIGTDVLFGMLAWQKLQNQFRLAAQERYVAPADFWTRFFPRAAGGGEALGRAAVGVKTG